MFRETPANMGKKPRKHGGSRESFRPVSRRFGGRTFAAAAQNVSRTFARRMAAFAVRNEGAMRCYANARAWLQPTREIRLMYRQLLGRG
jgi:hypothetical protein